MNANAATATGSGRVIQAHQVIAEDIKALGVDTVFGLMSDDTAVFCTALDGLGICLPWCAA
jgi:thiamine pyrophosphate-dependent acetolactate synthase large subunit-like protein